jgi:hypothetical protein
MADGGTYLIRTFLSEQEIRDEPGFLEDALFSIEDYEALLGDYRLPDRLRCCLKSPERSRCPATHHWGFVIRLKDATVTVVGNRCGNEKFGAESALSKDRKAYLKEKERQDALKRLRELLAARQASEEEADQVYQQLREMCGRGKAWLREIGFNAEKRLLEISKTDLGVVLVAGVRVREYVEDGRTKTERTSVEIAAGTLPGLSMFRNDLVIDVHRDIREVYAAYRDAEKLAESATTRVLQHAAAQIGRLAGTLARGREFLDAERAFQAADWSCLPFLTKDAEDRMRLARAALEHAKAPKGKDRAKAFIRDMETSLKARYGVQEILIL